MWVAGRDRAGQHDDREISCRRLNCPLPVVFARKALAAMAPGQVLKVTATDPRSRDELVALGRRSGAEFVSVDAAGGACIVLLRKP